MKIKIPKGKIKFLIPLVLVVVLAGGLFVIYQKGYLSRFFPISYADFSVNQGKVYITFSIPEKDQANYSGFLTNLGVVPSDNMNFQLDEKSTKFLSSLSPQRVQLTFLGDKDIKFQSKILPNLPSALSGKNYNFATKSGTISINYQDEKDYSLSSKGPGVLLEEATKSGKLYISKELEKLFPIVVKVATIDISVDSGAVSGEIRLK